MHSTPLSPTCLSKGHQPDVSQEWKPHSPATSDKTLHTADLMSMHSGPGTHAHWTWNSHTVDMAPMLRVGDSCWKAPTRIMLS